MIEHARTVPRNSAIASDLCVIGAGAAGISLAVEMDGSPFSVTVLESGTMELDVRTQALHSGESAGIPYFAMDSSRLRFFGGTTNHWGGVCQPFEAIDFEPRPQIPLSGWPVTRTELDPYYQRAATLSNVGSWELFRSGLDEEASAVSFGPHFTPRVVQRIPVADRRFRPNHRQRLAASDNVRVVLGANVINVETSEDPGSASHVAVATLDGNRFTVSARAFVLCTGAVENARILLASTTTHPGGLGNRHDQVGRFFTEHPRFIAASIRPFDPHLPVRFYDWHRRDGATFRAYLALAPESRRSLGLPGVQLRLGPTLNGRDSDLQEVPAVQSLRKLSEALPGSPKMSRGLWPHLKRVGRDLTRWQSAAIPGGPVPVPRPALVRELFLGTPLERAFLSRHLAGDIWSNTLARVGYLPIDELTVTAILQPVPNPESRVTLTAQQDALGVPRARLDWRLSDVDRHTLDTVLDLMAHAVGDLGIGRTRFLYDRNDSAWPTSLRGGYHQMGTTRMSTDPRTGVVDANCRVHDVRNLFVGGSSVFPTGGDGAPTITIVALAVRLADHLKRHLAEQ